MQAAALLDGIRHGDLHDRAFGRPGGGLYGWFPGGPAPRQAEAERSAREQVCMLQK